MAASYYDINAYISFLARKNSTTYNSSFVQYAECKGGLCLLYDSLKTNFRNHFILQKEGVRPIDDSVYVPNLTLVSVSEGIVGAIDYGSSNHGIKAELCKLSDTNIEILRKFYEGHLEVETKFLMKGDDEGQLAKAFILPTNLSLSPLWKQNWYLTDDSMLLESGN